MVMNKREERKKRFAKLSKYEKKRRCFNMWWWIWLLFGIGIGAVMTGIGVVVWLVRKAVELK